LLTSTLGLTYYSHKRVIFSKRHGDYPVINLLVKHLPISIETSNIIVHPHIEKALFISMTQVYHICLAFFSSTITTTGSLDMG